jgi:hypothetical protein
MTAGILFLTVFALGLYARVRPSAWPYLIAGIAFLPSSSLFYGLDDYAIRAGVLAWIPLAMSSRKALPINTVSVLWLWVAFAVAGNIVSQRVVGNWTDGLILTLTHTGFSLTYALLVATILPGTKLEKYGAVFVGMAFFFYVVGGLAQYWYGAPIRITPQGTGYVFDSYNYLTGDGRMIGLFEGSSHATASVLNVALAFQLARLPFLPNQARGRLVLVLLCVGIILCQNRGNMVAMAATCCAYVIFANRVSRQPGTVAAIVVSVAVSLTAAATLISTENQQRLADDSNIFGRLEIYRTFWSLRDRIISESFLGDGWFARQAFGTTELYDQWYQGLFGENQLLAWTGTYGWGPMLLFVVLLTHMAWRFWFVLRKNPASPDTWMGSGLALAWLSLAVAFLGNLDTNFLIVLLYTLTTMWMQQQQVRREVPLSPRRRTPGLIKVEPERSVDSLTSGWTTRRPVMPRR